MAGFRNNLAAGIYVTATQALGQIALVPLFLHCWGEVRYGQWLVIFSVPLYFTLSDVGINNALGNALTIAVEGGEKGRASRMLSSAWKGQLIVGLLLASLIGSGVLLLPLRSWFGLSGLSRTEFGVSFVLLSIYVLLVVQGGLFSSVFRAARRFPSYQLIQGNVRVLEVAGTVLVLVTGGGLVGLAAILAGLRFGALIWLSRRVAAILPGVPMRWAEGSWREFKMLLPAGTAFFVFPVSNALANQGTTLLVNHLGGALAVVLVNVCRQMARLFSQGVSLLSGSLHPELTTAFATGDVAKMRRLQTRVLSVVFWLSAPFLTGVFWCGPWVMYRWIRLPDANPWVLLAFAGEAVVVSSGALVMLSAWAVSRVRGVALAYLLAQGGALLATAAAFPRLGALAVALSFMTTNLAFCVYAAAVNAKVLETTLFDFARCSCTGGWAWWTARGGFNR